MSSLTILQRVGPLLGNDLETDNKSAFAAREQILNKQLYTAIAE
jgi:hypothetical protein